MALVLSGFLGKTLYISTEASQKDFCRSSTAMKRRKWVCIRRWIEKVRVYRSRLIKASVRRSSIASDSL